MLLNMRVFFLWKSPVEATLNIRARPSVLFGLRKYETEI
jgi:hypothetical protein